ncbi:hypothetical protein LMG22037_06038 [Paraburkholderia phenoliruptrix]|uniref:Uncharacterized protein n=1 Tax=Paraburkholderia phenoliruptrix TaxID=252970 RepID=A0A6J5CIK2_9BURK|nr:hypothetical protein LMG22037_06038 [Paraburkholderia phenoliruptrix]
METSIRAVATTSITEGERLRYIASRPPLSGIKKAPAIPIAGAFSCPLSQTAIGAVSGS